VPNSPAFHSVAFVGAAAIGASLIGFAALPQTSGPPSQTRAVALTSGDTDIYLPNSATFDPTVSNGFPPLFEVQQGPEEWVLHVPYGQLAAADLEGTDTQTTLGSFVNDYFVESSETQLGAVAPSAGSEIDLANFGGGYENELDYFLNGSGGYTLSDIVVTPSGDYTIPLGSTVTEPGAAVAAADGYSFTDLLSSIQTTTSYGEGWFTSAGTDFAAGYYPLALSEELAGFNNLTVGVGADLLTNGYAALTGDGGNPGYELINPGQPEDFSVALSEVQTDLASIQQDFSVAFTDFASGDTYSGLTELAQASIDSTSATDAIILGLFDSIPGMTFTA
jgi:hypothetical protein